MLTRTFHGRKKSPRAREDGGDSLSGFQQQLEDEEEKTALFGYPSDLPLSFCGSAHFRGLGLKEVLQSSVQVLGESSLGISEKVVLRDGAVFASKRVRKVLVGKAEFGRRVERLAHISADCQHLVPIRVYVYGKRIKVVLCSYYPMGSRADLLIGPCTPLLWLSCNAFGSHKAVTLIKCSATSREGDGDSGEDDVRGGRVEAEVRAESGLGAAKAEVDRQEIWKKQKTLSTKQANNNRHAYKQDELDIVRVEVHCSEHEALLQSVHCTVLV